MILDYMKKNHPEISSRRPGTTGRKPNLSSLEHYARDQKPAPARP